MTKINAGNGNGGGRTPAVTKVVYGQPARGVNPGAVGNLGCFQGNHTTDDGDFELKATPWNTTSPHNASQTLGNENATQVGRGGPGVGRIVHGCGSQGKF